MSKDELEKEAEEINITYENNVFHCTKNSTKWISIDGEKWYGEEKRIEELENQNRLLGERCNQLLKDKGELTDKIADIKANCDLAIEGRDIKIKELEQQIEKLIDFVLSKTECCDVCPITDTCINSEGTCPYVGILAKGEEAVTREWLMQKIVKEIKEK